MNNKVYIFGEQGNQFKLDTRTLEVSKEQKTPIDIKKRQRDLLLYFLENADRIISIEELIANVWSPAVAANSSVATAVSLLRKSIGDPKNNPKYIETVVKEGYKFIADVQIGTFEEVSAVEDVASLEGFVGEIVVAPTRTLNNPPAVKRSKSAMSVELFIRYVREYFAPNTTEVDIYEDGSGLDAIKVSEGSSGLKTIYSGESSPTHYDVLNDIFSQSFGGEHVVGIDVNFDEIMVSSKETEAFCSEIRSRYGIDPDLIPADWSDENMAATRDWNEHFYVNAPLYLVFD